jgi:hypothetical protein
METTGRTVPKIKVEDVMPTIEVNMMLIKGADAISKADKAHVREVSVLQTTVVVEVDNVVPTRKWSRLKATSVTTSAPIQI